MDNSYRMGYWVYLYIYNYNVLPSMDIDGKVGQLT
jgi:hypothetical protein